MFAGAALFVAGSVSIACSSDEDSLAQQETTGSLGTTAPGSHGIQDPNLELAEIAAEVPGFAGYAFDPSTNSYVIKSTVSDIDVEAVRRAILKRDPARATVFEGAEFRVEQVLYDATQLNGWYGEMKNVVIGELPEELFNDWTFADLDEANNRILVGFSSEEAQTWARIQIVENMDVPPGAIVVIHHPTSQLDEGEDGSR